MCGPRGPISSQGRAHSRRLRVRALRRHDNQTCATRRRGDGGGEVVWTRMGEDDADTRRLAACRTCSFWVSSFEFGMKIFSLSNNRETSACNYITATTCDTTAGARCLNHVCARTETTHVDVKKKKQLESQKNIRYRNIPIKAAGAHFPEQQTNTQTLIRES